MTDERIKKLAKVLVNYSCDLKKGEKVLIEAKGIDYMLTSEIVKEVYKVGAYPFVEIYDNRVTRELLMGETEELAKMRAEFDGARMNQMDAYIGIRGGENANELSDVPPEKNQIESEYYSHPVHHEIRVKKTKWVVLRYPNQGMAGQAGMSTEAFENFYFDVCTLDYSKMDKAMDKSSTPFSNLSLKVPNSFEVEIFKSLSVSISIRIVSTLRRADAMYHASVKETDRPKSPTIAILKIRTKFFFFILLDSVNLER